jgi:hypothetical protein
MAKHDEAARRRRRNFLKAAGGVAMAFVGTGDAYGQSARAKAATPMGRRRDEPADRVSGLPGTTYRITAAKPICPGCTRRTCTSC